MTLNTSCSSLPSPHSTRLAVRRFHYDTIDSTNEQARLLADQHPEQVLLVTAETQTAGRGRRGRSWQSPRGGVWMSLVWPMCRAPQAYQSTPLIAALATCRCIGQVLPSTTGSLKIKWPNDLLLAGRKVAGVLCEQWLPGHSSRTPAGSIVIGVGINVNFDPTELINPVRTSATTLRQWHGGPVQVQTVIDQFAIQAPLLMGQLEHKGFTSQLRSPLQSALAFIGQSISISTGPRLIHGEVQDLDEQGRLVVKTADGPVILESGQLLVKNGQQ